MAFVTVAPNNNYQEVSSGNPDSFNRLLVGTARDRFIEHWASFDPVTKWEVKQQSPGMLITGPLGGAAAGSKPYLNINSGTTANERIVLLSGAIFRPPFDLRLQITASQRIADNACRVGFLECTEDGNIVEATAPVTAPNILNARNAAVIRFDGTTATTMQLDTRVAGSAVNTVAMAFGATMTTVAGGTGPDFTAPDTLLMHVARERVMVRHHNVNDASGSTVTGFAADAVVPDGNGFYRLCIIVENGSTPPASATDWRIHTVNVLDGTRFDVSPRVAGYQDMTNSFPVVVTGFAGGVSTVSITGSGAEDAASLTTGIPALVRAANATPAAMSATGDAVRMLATMIGALVTKPHALQESTWNANLSLTTTTAQALAAAGGAGLRRHIVSIQAINTGAGAVDLILLDGVTERWRLTLPQNVPVDVNFEVGLLVTANTALNANLSATGTVRINAQGYTAP